MHLYLFFRLWMHKISETYCAHMFVHNYRSSSQNVRKQNFSKINFEVSLAILLDQRKKYSAIIVVHHSIVKNPKTYHEICVRREIFFPNMISIKLPIGFMAPKSDQFVRISQMAIWYHFYSLNYSSKITQIEHVMAFLRGWQKRLLNCFIQFQGGFYHGMS